MDPPTPKKHPKPAMKMSSISTTKNPDPGFRSAKSSFITNHFSRLNLNHRTRTSYKPTNERNHPPPPSIDIHLQAKALTVSADASQLSALIKSSQRRYKTVKEGSKEKVRRPSNDLDKKKSKQEMVDSKEVAFTVKSKEAKDLHEGHDMKRAPVSLGRRRSFCGSQVELGDILANCGAKIVSVDMPPFMQIHAIDCARKTRDSLEKFTSKTLALTLKKEFDGVYGPAWHCIVGTSFGSFVTHSVGGFLYFSMDQKLYILLFKTTVQRAD